MNKEKKNQFAFGMDETRCESGKFSSVEELLESAQSSWDEMDGNPFDEDCEYSGLIWVGFVEDFEPASFAPTLDWVADYMTDEFYGNYNIDDDSEVQINNKEEAKEAWKEFVNKYFEMPCNWDGMWFGVYNLKEHCWEEKFDNFKNYVKDE